MALEPYAPLRPARQLAWSFLLLIVAGTLLLLTPWATPADQRISVVDALFTATSATCVTGLVVRDTGSGFTLFGQLVILGLIQLGGIGIMTFSTLGMALVQRRLSFLARSTLVQTVAGQEREDLYSLLFLVFRFTFLTELAGAVLLWLRWRSDYGWTGAIYPAVFHSISAFCNAGFSLWADSLCRYRADAYVVAVVCGLIILGGLGFVTVHDCLSGKRRLSLHSRLVLSTTATLVAGGTALLWWVERGGLLAEASPKECLLVSLFQSVTARTAGFNTVDIGSLGPAALFLLILLMFIGGSPGGCAGGIKTTTFAVLVLTAWNRLHGRTRVNVANRTIPATTVANAVSITLAGITTVLAGLFCLLAIEQPRALVASRHDVFIGYLFETVSALGTVGLSTGITSLLSPASRLIVSALMFCGRLGPLTIALALARQNPLEDWQYPEEEVMVG